MREWGRLLRSFYRERKVGEYKLMKEARSTNDSSHCGDLLAHLIVNSNRALLAYNAHSVSLHLSLQRLAGLFTMYSQMRSLDPVRDARVRDQLRQKLIAKVEEVRVYSCNSAAPILAIRLLTH